ncbi:hypothetical protein KC19_10G024800 [Ceratodon purpureus]|uniref:Diacylglycerol kinase n=1 Tax=Ceratodon purpureus TaxID=3225 RepID=A0A8T0GH87_CERPU|nr:hypothetical protein KC19_10G024800 [Ceratodon purpureus]
MDSEEKSGAVVARVSDDGDGVGQDLGGEKPGVVDMDARDVNGNGKESSGTGHFRNGSMSFLAAPGYSPSFASLGDTNAFESHHAPTYSDSFEGFEPPRLSASQEVQETPKVTRPEGLSFTTPVVGMKIAEDFETPLASKAFETPLASQTFETPLASQALGAPTGGFATPVAGVGQEGENEGAEDYTSPIANLVEKPLGDAAPPSSSTPIELVPALGNVDSFSFGGVRPDSPQTPDVFPTYPKSISGDAALPSPSTPTELVPALGNAGSFSFGGMPETPSEPHINSKNIAGDDVAPSPSTPTELIPALGNVNSFPFGGIDDHISWPPTTNEPHAISMKIAGHELLDSFMTTNQSSTPHGVNAVNSPVVEAIAPASSTRDMPLTLETLQEPEPVAKQPNSDDVEIVQPKIHEAPLPEEPAVAIPSSEKLDNHATESSIIRNADPPAVQESVDTNNVALVSEAESSSVGEEVVQKPIESGTDTVADKDVGNALPQTKVTSPPETFAFHNVEAEKEVPAPAPTQTSKSGPFLGTIKSMSTKKWRGPSDDELRTMVVIPDYLSRDMANAVATEGAATPEGPSADEKAMAPITPILVFINSRSGGRLGPELMSHFEDLISSNQVYDLSKHSPSAVLRYGVGCLDRMANSGDECARQTRENLRILVAGGDGTVGWCLSSVGALREISATTSIPPLGIIPLGTGNDLSRSFGWGGEFTSTAKSSLKKCLVKALNSKAAPLDTWKTVVMPAKSVAAEDIQFPHSMHPQHHVPLPSSVAGEKHDKDETAPAFEGLFFNYFSVGMDAQVAYGFHHLRDEKPWLARSRKANEMIYSTFGCTQGWFCTACSMAPRARAVSNIMKLSVRKRGNTSDDWEEIHVPSNIRALVICNLKSYAGGHNPWGKPSSSKRKKEGLEEQRPDDGLLEIMGLKDGWHSAFVLLEVSTAVRLCQAEAVKLEFNGNTRRNAYLQMDGEPWMQPMGAPHDEPTVVMIEKLPSPSMVLKR